ncbi:unnamed protein product [Lactuca saligna]|uniref:R domain-containing protein n=1 Tax=Lactuca saligna TaxID=75948 RepID=A0AA35ZTH6_LACSI|nr:unnamed protein product [Lactuca saligna]
MFGIDDQSMEKIREDTVIIVGNAKSTSSSSNKEKKKLDRGVRKSAYIHNSLSKETREQARARARKRTTEKRYNKIDGGDVGGSGSDQYSKFRPHFDQGESLEEVRIVRVDDREMEQNERRSQQKKEASGCNLCRSLAATPNSGDKKINIGDIQSLAATYVEGKEGAFFSTFGGDNLGL